QCKHCATGTPGNKGGGVLTYHCLVKPCSIEEARADLLHPDVLYSTQYINEEAFISSAVVEGYQKALQINIPAQTFLKANWKFSQEALDFFKLGFDQGALTIPIYDAKGRCV